MLYFVRVYEGADVYEYEYGNEKHARQHLEWERCLAELYVWEAGQEHLLDSVNQTFDSVTSFAASENNAKMRPSNAAKL